MKILEYKGFNDYWIYSQICKSLDSDKIPN